MAPYTPLNDEDYEEVEFNDALLERLKSNDPTLTALRFWNKKIGDEGVSKLVEALTNNTSLLGLRLFGNGIGDEGAKELATLLESNTTLQEYVKSNFI